MATAISGCVIIKESTWDFIYQQKCDSCGYVFPGTVLQANLAKGTKLNGSFICPKCKKNNKLVIAG